MRPGIPRVHRRPLAHALAERVEGQRRLVSERGGERAGVAGAADEGRGRQSDGAGGGELGRQLTQELGIGRDRGMSR